MDLAKKCLDAIGSGKKNAVSRPPNSRDDRRFRQMIEKANTNGDCIIPSEVGYYRPNTPAEYREAEVYFKKELHRIGVIAQKIRSMQQAIKEVIPSTVETRGPEEKESSPESSVNWDTMLEEDSSFPGQMVMRM